MCVYKMKWSPVSIEEDWMLLLSVQQWENVRKHLFHLLLQVGWGTWFGEKESQLLQPSAKVRQNKCTAV